MIKLTNKQCDLLLSPLAQNLFTDQKRSFPTEIAFKLLDIITCIRSRIVSYHETFREIVEENDGIIEANGNIKYPSEEKKTAANNSLEILASIEIEINGFKLVVDDSWPKLSIAEAQILKPLIKEDNKNNA